MLYCCLDGKHVKYAWNSWPRGWGGWEMECIFLPAKRNHSLSVSPLILIKEFLELRCFSKRIEGHVLILFLRESWSDNVVFIFSVLLQSCKKTRTKQKNPSLSAPSPQARWQGVLLTLSVLPCPLVKPRGAQHQAEPWSAAHPAPSGASTEPGTPRPLKEGTTLGTLQFPLASAVMNLWKTLP